MIERTIRKGTFIYQSSKKEEEEELHTWTTDGWLLQYLIGTNDRSRRTVGHSNIRYGNDQLTRWWLDRDRLRAFCDGQLLVEYAEKENRDTTAETRSLILTRESIFRYTSVRGSSTFSGSGGGYQQENCERRITIVRRDHTGGGGSGAAAAAAASVGIGGGGGGMDVPVVLFGIVV